MEQQGMFYVISTSNLHLPSIPSDSTFSVLNIQNAWDPDDSTRPILLIEGHSSASEPDILKHLETNGCTGVEIYATSPVRLPIQPETVASLSLLPTITRTRLQHFATTGLAFFQQAVGSTSLGPLFDLVSQRIRETEGSIAQHHPELRYGQDAFAFIEIASRGLGRFDLKLPMCEVVQRLVNENVWMPYIKALLGDNAGCLVSVVYSLPGAHMQSWHADGVPALHSSHSHSNADVRADQSVAIENYHPYAICLFLPLIPLTPMTGFTQFWPRTHTSPSFIGFGPAAEVCGATVDACVDAGDVIMYDYATMHRGMGNQSATVRPVLQMLYHVDGWKETRNYGTKSIVEP